MANAAKLDAIRALNQKKKVGDKSTDSDDDTNGDQKSEM